jgi:superfamily I DNA/RNA helicase
LPSSFCGAIQYAWLRLLAGSDGVPFAVGDDDQSIYRWRGARVEHIHRFQKDFPGTLVVKLEQNYRSTATILNAANAVIANNASRLGKNLWTDGAEGKRILLSAACATGSIRATCARTRQSCIDRMRNPGCSRKALSMPAFRTVFTAACDFSSAWKSRTRLPTCA